MVPEDNGTQIISAANKQYKGRKSLAGVPGAEAVPFALKRVPDSFKKN